MSDAGRPPRIVIERLQVRSDRVVATVRMPNAPRVLTTPKLAARVCRDFPDLPQHACVNGEGPVFGAVVGHTPLPHLLEHLVIDLQVQAGDDPDRLFTGASRWTDREKGLAQVEVSYADDLAALRAFRDAAAYLNALA